MISQDENELLCCTGPGTPMGNLFRRFWLPVTLSRELPKPNCPPVRLWIFSGDYLTGQTITVGCAFLDRLTFAATRSVLLFIP